MPHDVILREIAGFRLVSVDPSRLAVFYRAIGFDIGEAKEIPAAEMALLGLSGTGLRTVMSLGRTRIDLDAFESRGRPIPDDATACNLDFQHFALVTDDAEAAWRLARDAGARPIGRDGPVTLPDSSGGVTAVKFRDPEGHPLEFLQFPPGANPDWTGTGIMGIDHSAISIGDLAASRSFYARHGLREADPTVNRGPEQDALDGLDGVKVDVVPMEPDTAPPHIELLGYRYPVGRARGPHAPEDIAATRIVWSADRDALLRDPDGHLHQLSREDRPPADTATR